MNVFKAIKDFFNTEKTIKPPKVVCKISDAKYEKMKNEIGVAPIPHPKGKCTECGFEDCSFCPWGAFYDAKRDQVFMNDMFVKQPKYDYSVYETKVK